MKKLPKKTKADKVAEVQEKLVPNVKNLFHMFRDEMNSILDRNDKVNGKSQRQLLNELFKHERDFRNLLLTFQCGPGMYESFMNFILDKESGKGNKLSIRPYLRERQDTFSKRVFPILDKRDSTKLYRFRINFLFARWVLDNFAGSAEEAAQLEAICSDMKNIRRLLCENNLPLALNRTKLFWLKSPEHHIQYMDLVQDSSKGLLEAIDNFCPPYKTVWRTTAIGRMTLNMTEDNSSTLVKLPPKDKRILYRTRKAKQENGNISNKDLESFVGESFAGTTSSEIELIEAAANQVSSIDEKVEGSYSMADKLADPKSLEEKVEADDLNEKLYSLMENLCLLEIKVLQLKHGEMSNLLD